MFDFRSCKKKIIFQIEFTRKVTKLRRESLRARKCTAEHVDIEPMSFQGPIAAPKTPGH